MNPPKRIRFVFDPCDGFLCQTEADTKIYGDTCIEIFYTLEEKGIGSKCGVFTWGVDDPSKEKIKMINEKAPHKIVRWISEDHGVNYSDAKHQPFGVGYIREDLFDKKVLDTCEFILANRDKPEAEKLSNLDDLTIEVEFAEFVDEEVGGKYEPEQDLDQSDLIRLMLIFINQKFQRKVSK